MKLKKLKKLKITALRLSVFALILFFANFADAEDAKEPKPVKIAIIGDTEKHLADLDMLTVKLSSDDNIHVLERSDWDYLLRERNISASKIGQSSVEIGRLLGADALIILTEEEIKGKKYLLSKLVAVKSGVILDSIVSSVDDKKKEAFSLADSIEFRFKPKFAKLADNQKKITISMLNLRSEIGSPELLTIEKELNTIFAQRLMREQNVLVSERWNIAEAAFEKNLDGKDSSGFKTGTVILDGTIALTGKDTVEVNLFVTTPDGKKQEFKVSGKKDDLGKLAEALNSKCLEIAKIATETVEWDREKEANEYYKEAMWAYHAGLFFKAAQSAESAWALGCRKNDLTVLRIKCYMGAAYSALKVTSRVIRFNPEKIDKHLDAGIMALEIYRHYILAKIKRNEKISKVFYGELVNDWETFGSELVSALSELLLNSYYEQCFFNFPDKQAFLSMSLKEINSYHRSYFKEKKEYPVFNAYTSAARYAPFWCKSSEETMELYDELLLEKFDTKKSYTYFSMPSEIRDALDCRSGEESLFLFIDRSGKYSEKEEKKLLDKYLKILSESKNPEKELNSLLIQRNIYHARSGKSKKKIQTKIYNLYKEHKQQFWDFDSFYLDSNMVLELTKDHKDFAYEYFYETLKGMNKERKWNPAFSVVRGCIKDSDFSKENVKVLHDLLESLLKKCPKLKTDYSFIQIQKEFNEKYSGEDATKLRPTSVREFYLASKQELGNTIGTGFLRGNSLYELFFKITDKKKKTIQFTLNLIDIKTLKNQIIKNDVQHKLNDLEFKDAHISKNVIKNNICIDGDNIAYASEMGVFVLNFKENKCIKLDIPYQKYTGVLLKDNILFAFWGSTFSLSPQNIGKINRKNVSALISKTSSGMIEVNLSTKQYKLICSSRRNPAKTILDNIKPYSFAKMGMLNDKLLFFSISATSQVYIYDTESKKITKLENMGIDFFKQYIKSYTSVYKGKNIYLLFVSEQGKKNFVFIKKNKKLIKKFKQASILLVKTDSNILASSSIMQKFLYQLKEDNDLLIIYQGELYALNKTGDDLKKIKLEQLFSSNNKHWYSEFSQHNIKNGLLCISKDYSYDQNKETLIKKVLFYKKDSLNTGSIKLENSIQKTK